MFQIEVLKSKIHRVRVTEANLNYVGSITIDEALMEAANLIEGEKVQILDIDNGERFETYVIKGPRLSGAICLNGAAARKVQVGDVVIIVSYARMDFQEAKTFKPWVIFPDTDTNRLVGGPGLPTRTFGGPHTQSAGPLFVAELSYRHILRQRACEHAQTHSTPIRPCTRNPALRRSPT